MFFLKATFLQKLFAKHVPFGSLKSICAENEGDELGTHEKEHSVCAENKVDKLGTHEKEHNHDHITSSTSTPEGLDTLYGSLFESEPERG